MERVGQRQGSAVRKAAEKTVDFIRKAGDFLLPPDLFAPPLAPAYAGSGFRVQGSAREFVFEVPQKGSNAMLFDVGKAPPRGSAARKAMEWSESIEVLMPGEKRDPKKLQVDYPEAQRALSSMKKGPRAVHQYLAYEACRLAGSDALVQKYTWNVVVGAWSEDFFFAPGESMKDICLGDLSKAPGVLGKLAEKYPAPKPGPARRIFMFISDTWKKITGDVEMDPLNRPYMAHFYDCTRLAGDRGLNVLNGELGFQSAQDRLLMYWNLAAKYYSGGDRPRAFVALGHAVHLMCDMHVPAHVHNDPHGPSPLLGKEDSLEKWTARADYPAITRGNGESNATIWCARTVSPPSPDRSWNSDNISQKLRSFSLAVAHNTQKFRSVDAKGKGMALYQDRLGPLSDAECHYQAETLIPSAIRDSAQLILNFADYVKRDGRPAADAAAAKPLPG